MHQSSFLPYLGFWDKVRYSDKFMICNYYDFSPNEMYCRTFYLDNRYLTVPVNRDAKILRDITLNQNTYNVFIERFKNYIFTFKQAKNYSKYRDQIFNAIESSRKLSYLVDLNMLWFLEIYNMLELKTHIIFDQPSDLIKNDRIFHFISDKDIYCTGSGGRNYLDTNIIKNVIKIQNLQEPLDYIGNILWYLFLYTNDEIYEIMNNKYKWEAL